MRFPDAQPLGRKVALRIRFAALDIYLFWRGVERDGDRGVWHSLAQVINDFDSHISHCAINDEAVSGCKMDDADCREKASKSLHWFNPPTSTIF